MGRHHLSTLTTDSYDPTVPAVLTRRLRTIPLMIVSALVLLATAPVTVPVAVIADAARWLANRSPFMATRILLFGLVYTWAETAGIVGSAISVLGAREPEVLSERTYRLQVWWAKTLLAAVQRIFGIRLEVEGSENIAPGPILVLAHHASLVDNLLPACLITEPYGIKLRYVLKAELLNDPAIDIVGTRVPNAFVTRGGESEGAVADIVTLTHSLGPGDGVLIFPEGTRFSVSKRDKALAMLRRRKSRWADLASELTSVLPPRAKGTLALLEATTCDVVVLAHRGLGGFATLADIWRGGMVDTTVGVRFRRVRRGDIPSGRGATVDWLFGVWHDIDRWITNTNEVRT